jgi:hypothetical protein
LVSVLSAKDNCLGTIRDEGRCRRDPGASAPFRDDRTERVNEVGARWLVECSTGRGLVESNHRIEIEQPDDGLAWSQVSDHIADLNGMPIARTTAGTDAEAGIWLSWGSMAATATEPTTGCFRYVIVTRFLVSALVHSFPFLDVSRIGMQELAQAIGTPNQNNHNT